MGFSSFRLVHIRTSLGGGIKDEECLGVLFITGLVDCVGGGFSIIGLRGEIVE